MERQLFKHRIAERALGEIRESINKAWVLGADRFRTKVEQLVGWPVVPRAKGDDRRSEVYRRSKRIY
ncbi:MAG: hypothetical protein GXP08_11425 [Gammaproteobacteria bacterium]|nr:hypothetical protein [Gammaproteobacteria bacterium]